MENQLANRAHLGNYDYPLVKSKLREWLALEDLYTEIIEAAEEGDRERFVSYLYSYISAAFRIPLEEVKSFPWYEIAGAFTENHNINRPSIDFPILKKVKEKQQMTKNGWEYPERMWYLWLHSLAKTYHWDIEYIANLDIEYGIALWQEIMVDEQQDREWQWGMSEIAYYPDTKDGPTKFHPLDRPEWMKPTSDGKIKKVKIKASMLPVGMVLKWDTDKNEYTKSQ